MIITIAVTLCRRRVLGKSVVSPEALSNPLRSIGGQRSAGELDQKAGSIHGEGAPPS